VSVRTGEQVQVLFRSDAACRVVGERGALLDDVSRERDGRGRTGRGAGVDGVAYGAVVEAESGRFLETLAGVDLDAEVPSCPGWQVADLVWHLAEVHGFWAQIVDRLLTDPSDADDVVRPTDRELLTFAAERRAELLDALARRSPTDHCWSWSELGGDVGWVARRQAHEALIHRADAELAAGVAVTRPGAALAADGVDELVRGFLVGIPEWARWTADGTTVAVACTDVGGRYVVELGRMSGMSPASGRSYDIDAAELLDDPFSPAHAEVVGDAWELDRWLWGRGEAGALTITGRREVVTRFRALAADATQ
jgi:uncharacterized protein (TIGR03083 family)